MLSKSSGLASRVSQGRLANANAMDAFARCFTFAFVAAPGCSASGLSFDWPH